MCGIASIISPSTPIDPQLIEKMTDQIIHRGPDGYGHFHDGQIALGHRRLAIVDLSEAGHQPMHYLDRYVITYNGEIYNHIEIRQELEKAGYQFQSHTDTEVIMAAYDHWGDACQEKFNGMWAFVIYDKKTQQIFCSRDRFGIKPMFYWLTPNGMLLIGSEIKQFMVHPLWEANMNHQMAYDYLAWGVTWHTDETMFQDVYSLKQGHSTSISINSLQAQPGGRLLQTQWYKLKATKFSGSFKEATHQFKQLFSNAVNLRLRADVPVGSCLSGGLDSSAVVGTVAEMGKKNPNLCQKTFSVCSHDKRFDEREWVDSVVSQTHVEPHYAYPDLTTVFEQNNKVIWHQEVPFSAAGVCMQWEVMSLAAKNKMKVLLDGQGSDEYLGGYHSFFAPFHVGLLKKGKLITLWQEIKAGYKLHNRSIKQSLIGIANMLLPYRVKAPFKKKEALPTWLDASKLSAKPISPYKDSGLYTSSISKQSEAALMMTNLPLLLNWEDRNSMAHSIESRVPFLDFNLVEYVLGLPDAFKMSRAKTKYILREAMKEVMPDKVANRVDKQGFIAPEECWLKGEGRELCQRKLHDAITHCGGLIKENSKELFKEIAEGKKPFNQIPWRIMNFYEWAKTFNVKLY